MSDQQAAPYTLHVTSVEINYSTSQRHSAWRRCNEYLRLMQKHRTYPAPVEQRLVRAGADRALSCDEVTPVGDGHRLLNEKVGACRSARIELARLALPREVGKFSPCAHPGAAPLR